MLSLRAPGGPGLFFRAHFKASMCEESMVVRSTKLLPSRPLPATSRGAKATKILIAVHACVPEYCNAGPRNGVMRCQIALWHGPAQPPGTRSPRCCTRRVQWPALGPSLKALFVVSKWRPGPFGWVGLGWPGLRPHAPPSPHTLPRPTPGDRQWCKSDQRPDFPVDPSVPAYCHAVPCNSVIQYQMYQTVLWSDPPTAASTRVHTHITYMHCVRTYVHACTHTCYFGATFPLL